ncbi:hypothetical protein Shyd_62530 [Streptomyces hydrogenans]|uniref:Uncharacterized protein n=1 Tax=Streptomyces hydrogenans TaxID=1873719 RepID=A0ABQ3PIN3_9ACTN|nr:hypothetical protein Shyd_62530 [Streptomyces hydrogenans]
MAAARRGRDGCGADRGMRDLLDGPAAGCADPSSFRARAGGRRPERAILRHPALSNPPAEGSAPPAPRPIG